MSSVVQTHGLKVRLYLADDQRLITTEPAIDEVFRVVERCGQACKDIIAVGE